MNEANIQKSLFNEFGKSAAVMVPNIYYNSMFEMDLLRITNSLILHEYEIKTSRSDYLNEFKNKKRKHQIMEKYPNISGPNYYWFACPEGIIKPEDVENTKYGLVYANQYRVLKIVNAKKLHSEKITEVVFRNLAHNLMYKLFYHAQKYNKK